MSKKQKILAAVSAIVIVLALIGVAVGMNLKNNGNEVEETLTSSLVSQSVLEGGGSSKNDSSSIPEAPENSESTVDKSGATLFPGDKESSSSEEVTSSESTTSESSSSTSASSTSSTNSETSSSASESTSSSTSTSTSTPAPETSSSSASTPAPEQSSSSSVAPSSNPSGQGVSQGSTGTTSFGTTYPIISEFNKNGLNASAASFWSYDSLNDFEYTAREANEALGKAVGSLEASGVAFTLDGTGCIISCGSAWVERQPSKGQYLFVYGVDFNALSDGGDLSREIIKVMLGTSVTSTPIEVEKALWDDCFGDNSVLDEWTTVGDCQLKFGSYDGTKWIYGIRPIQ